MGRSLGGGLREFKDSIAGRHKDEDEDEDEGKPELKAAATADSAVPAPDEGKVEEALGRRS